jgi:hypothetical protein
VDCAGGCVIVTYNAENISKKLMTATVTKSANTGYDTATIASSIPMDAFMSIQIDSIFDGFVYSCTRNSRATYTIECRSHTAKLTTPFHSESVNIIEEASTSHTLCSQYTNGYGFAITNECQNLDFGGGYQRSGTPLSALANIANVTGAEYYPFLGGIKITPNIGIQNTSPKVIDPKEIHDYIPIANTIENQGIRYIVVGTESITNSINTIFKCDAKVEPCNGYTVVNIVPANSFSESVGISLTAVNSRLIHDSVLSPSYTLQLETEIASITHLFIGGAELLVGFSFILDTIIFDEEQSGIVYIDYIGKQRIGYAPIATVSGRRYSEFQIFYGNCDRYAFASTMNCTDDNSYRQCGDSFIITPRVMNYVSGFKMSIFGLTAPTLQFYADQEIMNVSVLPIAAPMSWVERGILSQEGAVWKHILRFPPEDIVEIRSAGTTISPTSYSLVGSTISFSQFFDDVLISYTTRAFEYFVQLENEEGKRVRMVVSSCEYPLDGMDYDSTNSVICSLGITIPIDCIQELGATPAQAVGKSISMSDPNGVVSNVPTDNFGVARIENSIFGTYLMNTGNIIPHSSITVKVGAS